jgi:glycosyltransferase 2 family protein
LPGCLGVILLSTFYRTYRWVYLLRPIAPDVSRWRVFAMGLIGFSATFLAPLRSGEVVRPLLISRDGEVSFFQATGTVGAERVIDGLLLTLLTFLALWLAPPQSPLPDRLGDLPLPVSALPAAVYSTLIMFVAAFAAMALFYWARDFARRITHLIFNPISPRLAAWLTGTIERLAQGLSFLPSRVHLTPFLRDTCLYWGLGIVAQWLFLWISGIHANPAQACVTLGVVGLGSLVPAGPGFFGAFQIAGFSALALYFALPVVKSEGAAFIFMSYIVQCSLNISTCFLGLWMMTRFPGAARTSEQTDCSAGDDQIR